MEYYYYILCIYKCHYTQQCFIIVTVKIIKKLWYVYDDFQVLLQGWDP